METKDNQKNIYSFIKGEGLFHSCLEYHFPPLISITYQFALERLKFMRELPKLAKEKIVPTVSIEKELTVLDKCLLLAPNLIKENQPKSTHSYLTFASDNKKDEKNPLESFLECKNKARNVREFIYATKEGKKSASGAQCFGIEVSETEGCFKKRITSTLTREKNQWAEFVITYDNRIVLPYSPNDLDTEKLHLKRKGFKATKKNCAVNGKQPEPLDFDREVDYETIGCGTFLKVKGKLKIQNEKIIICSAINPQELAVIYYVLIEKGIPKENIEVLNEQEVCTSKEEKLIEILKNEENIYPLAKKIAENTSVDITKRLADLFSIIDYSLLNIKEKSLISTSEFKVESEILKVDIITFLASLVRNDLYENLFKVTEKTIQAKLNEINKNLNFIEDDLNNQTIEVTKKENTKPKESQFDFSRETFDKLKNSVSESIYNFLIQLKNIVKNIDEINAKKLPKIKNDVHKITENFPINLKANFPKPSSSLKNIDHEKFETEKLDKEKKAESKINLELITINNIILHVIQKQSSKGYNIVNLKKFIDAYIYENLSEINDSILSVKNENGLTLKESTGSGVRQNFAKVKEGLQHIKSKYDVDLSKLEDLMDILLHYIFNLKFQNQSKVVSKNEFEQPPEELSKELRDILLSLQGFLAKPKQSKSISEAHIRNTNALVCSPFMQFYTGNSTGTCIALLQDYTKGGFWKRLWSFAWRRHHIKAAEQVLKKYHNSEYPDNFSVRDICREFFNQDTVLTNYNHKKGTLYDRLLFCEKLEKWHLDAYFVPQVPTPKKVESVIPIASSSFPSTSAKANGKPVISEAKNRALFRSAPPTLIKDPLPVLVSKSRLGITFNSA